MTEQQPYRVVSRHPGFELRRYPAHLVAEMQVQASFTRAPIEAFRPLAGYLAGANRARHAVGPAASARSAAGGPEKIAMTAPVVQVEGEWPGAYLIQFVLPATLTTTTVPEPVDSRVRVREVAAQLAAAMRFSGRWTERAFSQRATMLGRSVTAAGLQPTGAIRYARFDPPWKPWFLRRNEVVLPVVD
ncbi:heme-binding protein [Micromonospora sp. WMMD1120]|uniref:SOUL family heme-binding protein n=1 Tax=Micromonospora sp. WMMD1120 TaxID=3016106 RepID=UPI0024163D56|nr:heme-binding protein [Micromonospora sp. WMMD1120]MDG4808108.1 heme-binding protein [Micromonospora sp. WMMD1120]